MVKLIQNDNCQIFKSHQMNFKLIIDFFLGYFLGFFNAFQDFIDAIVSFDLQSSVTDFNGDLLIDWLYYFPQFDQKAFQCTMFNLDKAHRRQFILQVGCILL